MTGRSDERDDALEDELRSLLSRADAPPSELADQARRAPAQAEAGDSCLLDIAYDSVLDGSLVRAEPDVAVRLLSFVGAGLRMDVRVVPDGGALTLSGCTAPLRASAAMLETEVAPVDLPVDADGTFTARGVTRARVRLHVTVTFNQVSRRFHTNWFKY